jgi:CheY-like chemotaxis protein
MNEKKTILIIEDEIPLRNALKDKFSNEGFNVLEAKNGQEGLDMAFGQHPDLILFDIIMPVMDGITMLKKLREDVWGKTVEAIALTNLSDTGHVTDAVAEGAFYYLVKSDWKLEDVVKLVREKLKM